MTLEVPTGSRAGDAWSALGRRGRRDVRRLARYGRRHHDPQVAAVAVGWARWTRRDVLKTVPLAMAIAAAGLVLIAQAFELPPQVLAVELAVVALFGLVCIVLRRRVARRVERANLPGIFSDPGPRPRPGAG